MKNQNPRPRVFCLHKSNRVFIRVTSSLILFVFCSTSIFQTPVLAQAVPILFNEIYGLDRNFIAETLPVELGVLDEYYQPRINQQKKFIVHIQDAHANPEAQRKIQAVLDFLYSHKDQKTLFPIAVEGAQGELHPEYLNFFPGLPEVNERMIQHLLEVGEITGAELFAWNHFKDKKSLRDIVLTGVEEPGLYRKNLKSYQDLLAVQDKVVPLLTGLSQKLDAVTSKHLNADLREFIQERKIRKQGQYEPGGESVSSPQLGVYLTYLTLKTKEILKIDLDQPFEQVRFPNLVRVLKLHAMTESVPSEADAAEVAAFAAMLHQRIKTPKHRDILNALEKIQTNRSPRAILEKIWVLAPQYGIRLESYSSFWKVMGKTVIRSEINTKDLFQEMNRLETGVIQVLAKTENEKKLIHILEQFELIEKIVSLKFVRDDFLAFKKSKHELLRLAFLNQLRGMIRKEIPEISGLEPFVRHAFNFYQDAEKRDRILLENTLALTGGKEPAMLITGGFHTLGLTQLMRATEVPYAVIQPKMTSTDHEDLYHRVLRNKNADLSAYFDQPYLNKQEALYLKTLLEVAVPALWEQKLSQTEIASAIAQAINHHPVLSRRIQAAEEVLEKGSELRLEIAASSNDSTLTPTVSHSAAHAVAVPANTQAAATFTTIYPEESLPKTRGIVLVLGFGARNQLTIQLRSETRTFSLDKLFERENIVPIVTPLKRLPSGELAVDEEALTRYLTYLKTLDVHSVLVAGATGESHFMSPKLRRSVIEILTAATKQADFKVFTNVTGKDADETIGNAAAALTAGADALVAAPLVFLESHETDKIDDLLAELNLYNKPVILYNNPGIHKVRESLSVQTVEKQFKEGNAVAIKDSSGDLEVLGSYLKIGIPLYTGDEGKIVQAVQLGALGVVGSSGSVTQVLQKIGTTDSEDERADLQKEILEFRNVLTANVQGIKIPAGLKRVLARRGIMDEILVNPGAVLSDEEAAAIDLLDEQIPFDSRSETRLPDGQVRTELLDVSLKDVPFDRPASEELIAVIQYTPEKLEKLVAMIATAPADDLEQHIAIPQMIDAELNSIIDKILPNFPEAIKHHIDHFLSMAIENAIDSYLQLKEQSARPENLEIEFYKMIRGQDMVIQMAANGVSLKNAETTAEKRAKRFKRLGGAGLGIPEADDTAKKAGATWRLIDRMSFWGDKDGAVVEIRLPNVRSETRLPDGQVRAKLPENLKEINPLEEIDIKGAMLDWDGTISRIREGWEWIMAPLVASILSDNILSEKEWDAIVASVQQREYLREQDMANSEAIGSLIRNGRFTSEELDWAKEMIEETKGMPTRDQFRLAYDEAISRGRGEKYENWVFDRYAAKNYDRAEPEVPLTSFYYEPLQRIIDYRFGQLDRGEISVDELLVPGGIELIRKLQASGVDVRILTGSDEGKIIKELNKLGLEGIPVKGQDHEKGKMEKEDIMRDFQLTGNQGSPYQGRELLVIGDGITEIKAGVKLGWVTILIRSLDNKNEASFKRLLAERPNYVFPEANYGNVEAIAAFLVRAVTAATLRSEMRQPASEAGAEEVEIISKSTKLPGFRDVPQGQLYLGRYDKLYPLAVQFLRLYGGNKAEYSRLKELSAFLEKVTVKVGKTKDGYVDLAPEEQALTLDRDFVEFLLKTGRKKIFVSYLAAAAQRLREGDKTNTYDLEVLITGRHTSLVAKAPDWQNPGSRLDDTKMLYQLKKVVNDNDRESIETRYFLTDEDFLLVISDVLARGKTLDQRRFREMLIREYGHYGEITQEHAEQLLEMFRRDHEAIVTVRETLTQDNIEELKKKMAKGVKIQEGNLTQSVKNMTSVTKIYGLSSTYQYDPAFKDRSFIWDVEAERQDEVKFGGKSAHTGEMMFSPHTVTLPNFFSHGETFQRLFENNRLQEDYLPNLRERLVALQEFQAENESRLKVKLDEIEESLFQELSALSVLLESEEGEKTVYEQIGEVIKITSQVIREMDASGKATLKDYFMTLGEKVDQRVRELLNSKSSLENQRAKLQAEVTPDNAAIHEDVIRNLTEQIKEVNQEYETLTTEEARKMLIAARNMMLPNELREEMKSYMRLLAERLGIPVSKLVLAIRSSGVGEDSETASFAGRQDTYIFQTPVPTKEDPEGLDNLIRSWIYNQASLFNKRAINYRFLNNLATFDDHVEISTLFQEMFLSNRSFIAFSVDRATGFPSIAAQWTEGQGELLVSGAESGSQFIHTYDGRLLVRQKGDRKFKVVETADGMGKQKVELTAEERREFSMTDLEAMSGASQYFYALHEFYGPFVDLEGAVRPKADENGEVIYLRDPATGEPLWDVRNKPRPDWTIVSTQARPETVFSQENPDIIKLRRIVVTDDAFHKAERDGRVLNFDFIAKTGGTGQGEVKWILDKEPETMAAAQDRVMVTRQSDPDMESAMRASKAIVAILGGQNSHTMIVASEFGLVAITGVNKPDAFLKALKDGDEITIDAERGKILLGFDHDVQIAGGDFNVRKIPDVEPSSTRSSTIVATVEKAFRQSPLAKIPSYKGIGLMRLEIALAQIGIYPELLLAYDNYKKKEAGQPFEGPVLDPKKDAKYISQVEEFIAGYNSGEDFYVSILSEWIRATAEVLTPPIEEVLVHAQKITQNYVRIQAVQIIRDYYAKGLGHKEPLVALKALQQKLVGRTEDLKHLEAVIGLLDKRLYIRMDDRKSDEYKNVVGAELFINEESNPMKGWRGLDLLLDTPHTFRWQLAAIRKVAAEKKNKLGVFAPVVRRPEDVTKMLEMLDNAGLTKDMVKRGIMTELPTNSVNIEDFLATGIDFISTGGNDGLQTVAGLDRNTNDPALKAEMSDFGTAVLRWNANITQRVAEFNKRNGTSIECGFCGNAPSVPGQSDFAVFLREAGYDSASVTVEAFETVASSLTLPNQVARAGALENAQFKFRLDPKTRVNALDYQQLNSADLRLALGFHYRLLRAHDEGKLDDIALIEKVSKFIERQGLNPSDIRSGLHAYEIYVASQLRIAAERARAAGKSLVFGTDDGKTDHYRALEGGKLFEMEEANPDYGVHGLAKVLNYDKDFFEAELEAVGKVLAEYPDLALALRRLRNYKSIGAVRELLVAKQLNGISLGLDVQTASNLFEIQEILDSGIKFLSVPNQAQFTSEMMALEQGNRNGKLITSGDIAYQMNRPLQILHTAAKAVGVTLNIDTDFNSRIEPVTRSEARERFNHYVEMAERAIAIDGGDDYFTKPTILSPNSQVQEGDSVIMFDYRGDRAIPMLRLLNADPNFKHFPLTDKHLVILPFGEYDDAYYRARGLQALMPLRSYEGTLGEIIAKAGLRQLRIAESEKYKHVTYFFDGLRDLDLPGVVTIQVPSNKLDRHDEKPNMKADEITAQAIPYILGDGVEQSNFVFLNWANMDILGHFDNFDAAVQGALAVDRQLPKLWDAVQKANGVLIVVSDHGSGEAMARLDENGRLIRRGGKVVMNKAHAFDNPVEMFVLGAEGLKLKVTGNLRNIAPTVLQLMGLQKPGSMNAESLIENYSGKPIQGPVVLAVRDGWGLNKFDLKTHPEAYEYDATYQAMLKARKTGIPFNQEDLLRKYPHTKLWAHGKHIGHPAFQMGDSENGHFSMGIGVTGDRVKSPLSVLDEMLKDPEVVNNPLIRRVFDNAKQPGKRLHLIGMASGGGVHSHVEHLEQLMAIAAEQPEIRDVILHAFFDGRDIDILGSEYLRQIGDKALSLPKDFANHFRIGTIQGRNFGKDRDGENRDKKNDPKAKEFWIERTKPGFDAINENLGRRGEALLARSELRVSDKAEKAAINRTRSQSEPRQGLDDSSNLKKVMRELNEIHHEAKRILHHRVTEHDAKEKIAHVRDEAAAYLKELETGPFDEAVLESAQDFIEAEGHQYLAVSHRSEARAGLEEAVEKMRRQYSLSAPNAVKLQDAFLKFMTDNLPGDAVMIRNFQKPPDRDAVKGREFIDVDMGGTNLRVVLKRVNENGTFSVLKEAQPYTFTEEDKGKSLDDLMAIVADKIGGITQMGENYDVEVTWSGPVKLTGIDQGTIQGLDKGWKTQNAIGNNPAEVLRRALIYKSVGGITVSLLQNDTTRALVHGNLRNPKTTIGVVNSTGFNIAYFEKLAAVLKDDKKPADLSEAINTQFGAQGVLPELSTPVDKAVDAEEVPGEKLLEKMISGRYLGAQMRYAVMQLMKEKLLFPNAGNAHRFVGRPGALDPSFLSVAIVDQSPNLDGINQALTKVGIKESTIDERKAIQAIANIITTRSVQLLALSIASVIRKVDPTLTQPQVIALDSSLFDKMPGYAQKLQRTLGQIFGDKSKNYNLFSINQASPATRSEMRTEEKSLIDFGFFPVSFGTFTFGRSYARFEGESFVLPDRDAVRQALKTASNLVRNDNGVYMIDTAKAYGKSEEQIGLVLRELPEVAQGAFIATKWGISQGQGKFDSDHSLQNLRVSFQESLQHLGKIDLFYIHNVTPEVLKDQDVMEEMRRLKREKEVRFIGVTIKTDGEKELESIVNQGLLDHLDAMQISAKVFLKRPDLIEQIYGRGIAVFIHSPISSTKDLGLSEKQVYQRVISQGNFSSILSGSLNHFEETVDFVKSLSRSEMRENWDSTALRIEAQIRQIEKALGTLPETEIASKVGEILLEIANAHLSLSGEEVEVLSGPLEQTVIGRIDRVIAEKYGYSYQSTGAAEIRGNALPVLWREFGISELSDQDLAEIGSKLEQFAAIAVEARQGLVSRDMPAVAHGNDAAIRKMFQVQVTSHGFKVLPVENTYSGVPVLRMGGIITHTISEQFGKVEPVVLKKLIEAVGVPLIIDNRVVSNFSAELNFLLNNYSSIAASFEMRKEELKVTGRLDPRLEFLLLEHTRIRPQFKSGKLQQLIIEPYDRNAPGHRKKIRQRGKNYSLLMQGEIPRTQDRIFRALTNLQDEVFSKIKVDEPIKRAIVQHVVMGRFKEARKMIRELKGAGAIDLSERKIYQDLWLTHEFEVIVTAFIQSRGKFETPPQQALAKTLIESLIIADYPAARQALIDLEREMPESAHSMQESQRALISKDQNRILNKLKSLPDSAREIQASIRVFIVLGKYAEVERLINSVLAQFAEPDKTRLVLEDIKSRLNPLWTRSEARVLEPIEDLSDIAISLVPTEAAIERVIAELARKRVSALSPETAAIGVQVGIHVNPEDYAADTQIDLETALEQILGIIFSQATQDAQFEKRASEAIHPILTPSVPWDSRYNQPIQLQLVASPAEADAILTDGLYAIAGLLIARPNDRYTLYVSGEHAGNVRVKINEARDQFKVILQKLQVSSAIADRLELMEIDHSALQQNILREADSARRDGLEVALITDDLYLLNRIGVVTGLSRVHRNGMNLMDSALVTAVPLREQVTDKSIHEVINLHQLSSEFGLVTESSQQIGQLIQAVKRLAQAA